MDERAPLEDDREERMSEAIDIYTKADERLTGVATILKVMSEYDRERYDAEPMALGLLAEVVEAVGSDMSAVVDALRG